MVLAALMDCQAPNLRRPAPDAEWADQFGVAWIAQTKVQFVFYAAGMHIK